MSKRLELGRYVGYASPSGRRYQRFGARRMNGGGRLSWLYRSAMFVWAESRRHTEAAPTSEMRGMDSEDVETYMGGGGSECRVRIVVWEEGYGEGSFGLTRLHLGWGYALSGSNSSCFPVFIGCWMASGSVVIAVSCWSPINSGSARSRHPAPASALTETVSYRQE